MIAPFIAVRFTFPFVFASTVPAWMSPFVAVSEISLPASDTTFEAVIVPPDVTVMFPLVLFNEAMIKASLSTNEIPCPAMPVTVSTPFPACVNVTEPTALKFREAAVTLPAVWVMELLRLARLMEDDAPAWRFCARTKMPVLVTAMLPADATNPV